MEKVKKWVVCFTVAVMALSCGICVMASGRVPDTEKNLLRSIKENGDKLGVSGAELYRQCYAEVESYLADNETTEAQRQAGIDAVNAAAELISAEISARHVADAKELQDVLSNEESDVLTGSIIAAISPKLEAAGIQVQVTPDMAHPITLTDAKGRVVVSTSQPLQATGYHLDYTMAVIAVLAGTVAVYGVLVRKKELAVMS